MSERDYYILSLISKYFVFFSLSIISNISFYFQEAYRRWVCSTLIPYFAEPDDIRQNLTTVNKNGNISSTKASTSSSSRSSRNVNDVKENVLTGLVDHEEDPVLSRLLKR